MHFLFLVISFLVKNWERITMYLIMIMSRAVCNNILHDIPAAVNRSSVDLFMKTFWWFLVTTSLWSKVKTYWLISSMLIFLSCTWLFRYLPPKKVMLNRGTWGLISVFKFWTYVFTKKILNLLIIGHSYIFLENFPLLEKRSFSLLFTTHRPKYLPCVMEQHLQQITKTGIALLPSCILPKLLTLLHYRRTEYISHLHCYACYWYSNSSSS